MGKLGESVRDELSALIEADDRPGVDTLLDGHPEVQEALRDPEFRWGGRPPLAAARSVETARRLLDRGARLEHVSRWWAPGFGVIKGVEADVGRHLVEQGAEVSPHAAAGLGLTHRLEEMIGADPDVVHAKGGDGCRPLHFARNLETARLLVEAGAELDARDEDHDSTPAQWLIGDAPDVARYLVDAGATPDIFLAAALGDRALAERLIAADRRCLALMVGKEPDFPPIGYKGLGGTIYQWTLGFNSFAHQYAAKKGHQELCEYLFAQSDTVTRFLVACVMARREDAERIARENPGIVEGLPDIDKELLARYCWETNADLEAVRLMLDLGFPIDHPETRHDYSPLHNAAWGGYADIVDLLIERGAPIDLRDPEYDSTPLSHAIWCACEDGRHPEGDYRRVVGALIDAGSPWDPSFYPTGDRRVDAALEPRLRRRIDGAAVLGDGKAVETFLARGASPEERDAALLCAARGGHVPLCRTLLEAGATNGPSGPDAFSPLHRAVAGGSHDVARLLLERGADVGSLNKYGSTPLHSAGWIGADRAMIDLLADFGAGKVVDVQNKFDVTALDWALEKGHEKTAAALRALGANG